MTPHQRVVAALIFAVAAVGCTNDLDQGIVITAAPDEQPDIAPPHGPACDTIATSDEFEALRHVPSRQLFERHRTFTEFGAAVEHAGIDNRFAHTTPHTVFVPTNAAFDDLGPFHRDVIYGDPGLLARILDGHIVTGETLTVSDLTERATVTTAADTTRHVDSEHVDGHQIVCANIVTSDGVIHAIDTLIVDN